MTMLAFVALRHLHSGVPPGLDAAMAYFAKIVGKWDAVAHAGSSDFKCKFTFEWNADHRGIHSDATIGMDTAKPMHSLSMVGYDPNAKAVYYVEAHDSDTLYTGHVYLVDNKLLFKFGNYGEGENEFVSTEWFVEDNHYISEIRQAGHPDATPMVRVELTRINH
jgi:hypothetical protein